MNKIINKTTSRATKTISCEICKKNVTPTRSPGIECSSCKKFSHLSCAKLSADQVKFINENSVAWLCKQCNKPARRSSLIIDQPAPTSQSSEESPSTLEELKHQQKIITDLIKRVEILEQLLAAKSETFKHIEASNNDVSDRVQLLEQQKCDNSAEVQGIPALGIEDPIALVQLLGEEINCEIKTVDIDNCFFIPNKDRLVVNFKQKSIKERFVRAGKRFSRAGRSLDLGNNRHRFFVNDQLSAPRKRLYYDAKQFARKYNYKFCWILNANILLKELEHSLPIPINSSKDLLTLEAKLKNDVDLLPERAGHQVENEGNSDGC